MSAAATDRTAPAALVIACAPAAGAVKPELAPLLGPERRVALQALLLRRAAAWAAAAAPGAAFFAVDGPLAGVAALLPPGVTAFAQEAPSRQRCWPRRSRASAAGRC